MTQVYVANDSDCILSSAESHGHFWEEIRDHPANAEVGKLRGNGPHQKSRVRWVMREIVRQERTGGEQRKMETWRETRPKPRSTNPSKWQPSH